MKIFIKDMLLSQKSKFNYNYEPDIDCCNMEGRDVKFNDRSEILCEITRKNNDDLYADINIHLDTMLNCVRCLDYMRAVEDVKISGILSKEDKDVDYDIIIIDDDYLDFDKIFYDAVFEHLNNNLYCKEDCKGLCHICGANLNNVTCNCEEENPNIDPRLAELKNFL
ncbi:MAG: YceD family protein [Peptoanaerobacter stomatis]|uniref:YceD family protein n=1 Tax=Peptoanaerobacter stomatis TaxID=796937 RepID=UPI003F9F8632